MVTAGMTAGWAIWSMLSSGDFMSRGGENIGASPAEKAVDLDAELGWRVQEIRRGEAVEVHCERIFKRFYPWVHGFFRRRGFRHQEAEDLAQEVLVRAFSQIGTLDKPEQLRAWLVSIATNVFRNELRSKSRLRRAAPEVSLDRDEEADQNPLVLRDTAPLPDEQFLVQEGRAQVTRVLAELPPQMRRCLQLRLNSDLKYREIAAVLKISIETVKAHLHQAKKRLGEALAEKNDGDSL